MAVRHSHRLPLPVRAADDRPVAAGGDHADHVGPLREPGVPAHDQVLGKAVPDQLRPGRGHRDRAGVPVRHELVGLLPLRGRCLRGPAGDRGSAGVLPGVDVPGLWIFGWGRLSKRLHLATIWLVAIGTQLSAYFILTANSWVQHPVGYVLNRATGRAELKNIFAVLTNSTLLVTFPHTIFASFLTAGMLVLGISGWHLLRERHAEVFARSARIALVVSFVSAVAFVGHAQAQVMTRQQPTKMAAAEALWSDEAPAGFSLFAVGDVEHGRNHVNLVVPHALSILATNTLNGEVKGINDVQAEEVARFGPGNYLPVVGVTYWTFRLMVGIGLLLGAFTFLGLVLLRYRRLERGRWFPRLALWGIGLPLLANTLGWVFTEMGRQPWVVYGLLRTALAAFTFVYGVLAAIDLWLMARWAKADPDELEGAEGAEPDSTLTMAY